MAAARALPAAAVDSSPLAHSHARPRPRVSRRDHDVLTTMERRASRVKAFLRKQSERPRLQRSLDAPELSYHIPKFGTAPSALSISIEATARRISVLAAALDMAHTLS